MKHLPKISLSLALLPGTLAVAAGNPILLQPDNVILCQANSHCSTKTLFGRSFKVLNTPRFTVMVSFSKDGDYTRADVTISNHSGLPLKLTPDDFRIEVHSPKTSILLYVPPADLKNVLPPPAIPPLPVEDAAPVIAASPQMLLASNPPTTNIDELYAAAKKREVLREAYDKAVAEQYLAPATIAPDESASGRVYFESDRRAQTVSLLIPLAGLVFEFPYQMNP